MFPFADDGRDTSIIDASGLLASGDIRASFDNVAEAQNNMQMINQVDAEEEIL